MVEAGAELNVVQPPTDELPESLDGFAGLVCLGGAMGALDDLAHPWLSQVRALLAEGVRRRIPTLGVCLGGQLLAVATGGQIRRIPDGPECGTLLVAKRDAAAGDPLFDALPMTPDVLQFHSDEVHTLPPGAQHLAASTRCANQAYRIGGNAYGLQFHIETTPDVVRTWTAGAPDVAATARPGQLDDEHLRQAHEDLAEIWRPFAHRFVQLVSGELTADPSLTRSLPLAGH